jgi:DNA (cytosine-5)-methyltransferase 1
MLNGLDLFSGGGGLAEGLHRWVRPVAYCEIERGAQRVLLSRMARGELYRAPIWDDVRTLRGDLLPEVDIIAGGFPCQDISVAGAGRGLAGKRSGLVFEYLRLISECRPRFVFMENVAALAFRGLDRVLLGLDDLGFDARWTIVSAAEVGAPHLRERIWIMAHSTSPGLRIRTEAGEGSGADTYTRKQGGCVVGRGSTSGRNKWRVEPGMGRVAHGVADRINRIRILGNGVVPLCAEEAFMRLMGLTDAAGANVNSETVKE